MAEEDREQMTLENFQGGALLEQFNRVLDEVAGNISDINTIEKPREIHLKIIFKPSEDRTFFEATGQVNAKLGGPPAVKATGDIIHDGKGYRAMNRKKKQMDLPFNVTRLKE